MKSPRRQQGASFALVGAVLLLVIVGMLGAQAVNRLLLGGRADARVQAQFEAAHLAMTQYVATAQRLPCPANPALDTGEEVPTGPGSATCSFPAGTIPWKTIGLARDEAVDPWGGKVSYRVYTGAAGSFTQPGGASMIQCDLVDPSPASVTPLSGGAGALCEQQALVTLRSSQPGTYGTQGFLHSKGFDVTEMAQLRRGAAYVLVSHGATGRGAYTTSGAQRDMPVSPGELANAGSAGPFVISPFSQAGTDPDSTGHFDDHVAYRMAEELIRTAGLYARDWPETATSQVVFTQATVEAAVGTSVTPGSGVGQVAVNFSGVVAAAIDSGGNPVEVTFATVGANSGIGVAGGGSALIQSGAGESLRFTVEKGNSRFGLTLVDFGTYGGGRYWEVAEVRFFNGGTQVGAPKYAAGCRTDGGLASFDIDAGGLFDRVDIIAFPSYDSEDGVLSGISAFLVGEIRTCVSGSCPTSLSLPSNECPYYVL